MGALIALVLAACASAEGLEPEEGAEADHEESGTIHWAYEGEEGPEHWGELSADFALCGTGLNQSPVDVAGPPSGSIPDIQFNYADSTLTVLNNGHTVQVNYDAGSSALIDGESYNLVQFHFHTPSEHTINGEHFPAEMHAVHTSAGGALAVVGILIEEGAENPAFSPVIANVPLEAAEARTIAGVGIDINAMLPEVSETYRYPGSLTTPPCSEGVSWTLIAAPVEMSAEQIAMLDAAMPQNNRPVQPLNDRELIEDGQDS
jgi:carbonic anhydrase